MEAVKKLFGHRKTAPGNAESDTTNAKGNTALATRPSRRVAEQDYGIDDFVPSSLFWRDPRFDSMPVLRNFERDTNMVLSKSSPGYEITEDDSKYQIAIDVPGVKAQDMKVEIKENGRVLHLSGGRKIVKKNATQETKFDKRFWVGDSIDTSKLSANLANGVLVVTAAKKPREEPKTIKITITEGPHGQ